MRRSISRWTMALATAGVLALPASSFAQAPQEKAPQQPQQQQQPQQEPQPAQPQQQPQPDQPQQPQPDRPQPAQPPAQPQPQPQPQPQQPPTEQPTTPPAQQPTTSAAQSTPDQAVSPQEHLRQAQQAVASIQATSVPAKNRSSLADLKRHLSNLEKMGSASSPSAAETSRSTAGKSASANKANWGTEVAAIDKIISGMVGNETSTSATSTPGATGTTGANRTGASSATIDDATRARLMEVRTHITAYAAGMAGTSSTPKTEAAMSEAPTATSPTTPSASPSTASPAQSQSPAPSQPSSTTPSAAPSSPAQNPPAGSQNPPTTQPDPNAPAQQPPAAGQQPPAEGQQPSTPGSADEAHRHLVAARDSLSQLTQLPAAAQLSGEARTQISQLISNFNELIGNPPDWRVSYKKVDANLTALIGPDNTDAEAQGGAPTTNTGATAAPGAVGTTGTATIELDPGIRAKLVDFRRSLSQFEKAAGGSK